MDRSLNINDLPDDILLHIQKQQIIPEIQLPRNPETTYLNRYTPFAKPLRSVCRRWKELVDLPSNYHTRLTTTVVQVVPFHCYGRETFRTHLEQSRSLLAVLFDVAPEEDWPDSDTFGNRLVEECAQEMYHLVGYGDRLIQVEANFASWQPDALSRHLVIALQNLGPRARLIYLNIQCGNLNFGIENAEDPLTGVEPCPALEELFDSMPSSEMEDLGSIQLRLPPFLTSLSLEADVHSFRKLLTPCTGLTELKLCIPSAVYDELYYWDQVQLDSLVSLELKGDTISVMDMLHLLGCDSVERIILKVTNEFYHEDSYEVSKSSDVTEPTSLPSLKSLDVRGYLHATFSTLAAISIPDHHVLQRFGIVAAMDPFERDGRDMIPETLPDLMGRIRTDQLEISARAPTCAALLKAYPYRDAVRHLRVALFSPPFDSDHSDSDLQLPYTRLLSLSVVAEKMLAIAQLLSRIHIGADTLTLDISYLIPYHDELSREREHLNLMIRTLSPSDRQRYFSISTLTLTWPLNKSVPAAESLMWESTSTFFTLAPFAKTLVVKFPESDTLAVSGPPEEVELFDRGWKYEPIKTEDIVSNGIWRLLQLNPNHTKNVDTIILEYHPPCATIGVLELVRPAFEEKLLDILAFRTKAGAEPLKVVTLRSFSMWDIPEVRDFPQDCGVLLRLEAVS